MEPITIAIIVVLGVVVGVPLLHGFWKEIGGARGAGRLAGPTARPRKRPGPDDDDEDR